MSKYIYSLLRYSGGLGWVIDNILWMFCVTIYPWQNSAALLANTIKGVRYYQLNIATDFWVYFYYIIFSKNCYILAIKVTQLITWSFNRHEQISIPVDYREQKIVFLLLVSEISKFSVHRRNCLTLDLRLWTWNFRQRSLWYVVWRCCNHVMLFKFTQYTCSISPNFPLQGVLK